MNEEIVSQMIQDRRRFHRRPELGWCEFETTYFIVQRLKSLGFKVLVGRDIVDPNAVMGRIESDVDKARARAVANGVPEAFIKECSGFTGAVAVWDTGRAGSTTALRFDIDALAIEETDDSDHVPNKMGFRSEVPGLMHACGHDAHAAVGLAVARWISENSSEITGVIKLIFQPAEEGVRGAAAIAASGVVDDVDWFAGAHIGCSAKLHQIGVSHRGYLATTKFDLELTGVPAAAGSPELGKSALMCGAAVCMSLGSLPGHSEGITRIQIGTFHAGTGRNIIAEKAHLQLEVRGESTKINDYMAANVEATVAGLAAAYGVEYKLTRMGEAVTYVGDEEAVDLLKKAASRVPSVTSVVDMNAKVGSEDCTMLIKRVQDHGGKAVFFYFGCSHHGHHKHDFDVQDEQSMPDGFGVFIEFLKLTNS